MKKSSKGISIVIPTFNRMEYLYSTLICLSNQKLKADIEYEIVIIDSGCDDTEAMVKTLKSVKVVYKKIKNCQNRSLLRNLGVENSHYSIICFLDNDMLVSPDFVQTHFDLHDTKENNVGVGARKFLLDFNIREFGEQNLIHNFNKLDNLAWYNDERLDNDINIQPWRFIYSHTLSMRKETFKQVGGFDTKYGNHWGFEDVELGIRLQQNKCTFDFVTETFNYHQPHFQQSQKEQKNKFHNEKLLMTTHNEYEVELHKCFFNNFESIYTALKMQESRFSVPNKNTIKQFDKIMGCLFSIDNKMPHKKMQLGLYCTEKDNSLKKVFIVDSFFDYPEIIQISILTQAFRLSYKVYFNKLSDDKENLLIELALKSGIVLRRINDSKYSVFGKDWNQNSKLFLILLPDVYQPEKRHFYLWLANKLISAKSYVKLVDMKSVEDFGEEEFAINADNIKENRMYDLGSNSIQFIGSSSMLLTNMEYVFPKNKSSYIFADDEYRLKDLSLKRRRFNSVSYCDEQVYNYLSMLSVDSVVNEICSDLKVNCSNNYCSFMENGFYEDGIDLVLNAFKELVKTDSSKKLTIKLQPYENLYKITYPSHNHNSKFSKLYLMEYKFKNDINLLQNAIQSLNLEKNVYLETRKNSIQEIAKFIDSNEAMLYFPRMICTAPQLFIAILLKKKIYIGEHIRLIDNLKKYCVSVKSEEVSFSEELKVPVSSLNLNYSSYKINMQDFISKIDASYNQIDEENKKVIMDRAEKIFNDLFE